MLLSGVGAFLVVTAFPQRAVAQSEAPPPVPQIVSTGVGEATVTPDRAVILFAVETRSSTAAVAGSENARVQGAVIAALRAKGVLAEHITTTGYSVDPNERFDNGQRRLIGYIARNTVVVDVQRIDMIGGLIDAALGAGANSIGGLRYYSTQIDAIQRSALESAVIRARADADVMARAAGGTLGGPLEIVEITDGGMPRPEYLRQVMVTGMAADAAPTQVVAGEQKVSVRVNSRWLFIPNK